MLKNIHTGESWRLISDVIESAKIKNTGFLVTINIEKTFYSLNRYFLIHTLKKHGFGQKFIL